MINIKKILLVLIPCFILLCILTLFQRLDCIDLKIADFFYNIRGEKFGFVYWFFRIITEFGYLYVVIVLMIVFFIVYKNKSALYLSIGTLITTVINYSMKAIISRERPNALYWWMDESSLSFPSGHSITAMYFYVVLTYFVLKSIKTLKVKKIIIIVSSFIILMVGISRLVLGVHYFTDILGGFMLGGILSLVTILVYEKNCKK